MAKKPKPIANVTQSTAIYDLGVAPVMSEIRTRAAKFALDWADEKRERAEKDTFWNEFFAIFGINRRHVAVFEKAVAKVSKNNKSATSFLDVFWAGVLLCEHKSAGVPLDKADDQITDYLIQLQKQAPQDVPRYQVASNFAQMRITDIETEQSTEFELSDLPKYIHLFDFMRGMEVKFREDEAKINIEAAEKIDTLYRTLKDNNYDEHALKQFIIRLLFCFFAEDTGIFDKYQFEDYIQKRTHIDGHDLAPKLAELFYVLNTPFEKRMKTLSEELKAFNYINGQLFSDNLPPAAFNSEMRLAILDCCHHDWSLISPEIFGSLFQGVMDSVERREMGAHYTEAVNILKVVNGLFMMELREEFATAVGHLNNPSIAKDRRADLLNALHEKISNLTFLDPACGCGNFLVVAYRELRLLELDILDVLYPKDQHGLFDISGMIKCHIGQFYGIELDEYATHIARVAMWLTDHQMNMLCAERLGQTRPTVPLTESATIINANSLHTDWQVTDYILGNPPFVGHSYRTKVQQADVTAIMPSEGKFGKLDYVACWHIKASRMMTANPMTKTAFVSTNSICQGEQAGILWGYLFEQGFKINFAHRTFQWASQASGKAAVHCIIVGFSLVDNENKSLFDYPDIKGEPVLTVADNINQYLVNAPSVILPSRSKPPVGLPKMTQGSKPVDGGNLILSASEKADLISKYPKLADFIKPFIGAEELINGKERYCLWFNGANIKDRSEFIKYPEIKQRIDNIKALRAESPTESVRELADEPWVFTQIRQPSDTYIAVPEVSSETRVYIPMGFLDPSIIVSNLLYTIQSSDIYLFGILISEMHMDWMRTVAGRLESRYRYTPNVYHAFPFPTVNDNDKKNIATLAQKVLDERAKELTDGVTLAMLYNVDTMPTNLKKAHKALDKAVEKLYDSNGFKSDSERVGFLFERYNQLHA